jgi:methyl-accepting chemotaxis protein
MKLTIGQKVILGHGLALLFMAAIGITAYWSTAHLAVNTNWVTHTHLVLGQADLMLARMVDSESVGRGYALTGDERYLEPFEGLTRQIAEARKAVRDLTADNPGQQGRLDTIEPLVERQLAYVREIINLRRQKGFAAALQMIETDRRQELMTEIRNLVTTLEGEEHRLLRLRDQETRASAANTTYVIVYGSLLGFGLVSLVGFVIHRSITRPLAEFQKFVAAVGEGDLTQQSSLQGGDELGRLAASLNRMVTGLKEVAVQTRAATDNLNSATVEILATVKQQAVSTGEQAAACQETNATMQQVSQSCLQIAERAKEIAITAEATSAASNSGAETVQNTNRTMDSIREQAEAVAENIVALSEKTQMVGEIIATVNDIAEQSHLLALNAAIEAAAAGEHGRSFSVVAGEIKNLADQSKEATVQVKTILGDIQKGINSSVMLTEEAVKRVDVGKQQADLAASTIREMTVSIQQSVQAFQQIVAGTNQQMIGFEHVVEAVKDIAKASDQNASGTRQMEVAAANITVMGQQLRKTTDRYKF